MTARNYCLLAAAIFAIIAILQLIRALAGWPLVVIGSYHVPIWLSWIPVIVGAGLATIGYQSSSR